MLGYGYTFKLVIVGAGAVGKTALLNRYIKRVFLEDYKMTIGVQFLFKSFFFDTAEKTGAKVSCQIWDMGGQQSFRFLRPSWYKGAKGVLLLFDITRMTTFEDLPKWVNEIKKYTVDCPIIIIGNKSDLKGLRGVDKHEARRFAKANQSVYIETSAKTGKNVDIAFSRMIIEILKKNSVEVIRIKDRDTAEFLTTTDVITQFETRYKLSDVQQGLITSEVDKILKSKPPKDIDFRFLLAGNEESQNLFLSKLFRVERIIWPPKTFSILYNTSRFKMEIASKEYQFQVFFLSNIKELIENNKLFIETCKVANGIMFFYNPNDQKEFKEVVDMCIELRNFDPKLEIILTAGSDDVSTPYYKLNQLEKKHQINNHDDYESLLAEMLINTLKRKRKISKKRKFYQDEARKLQDQLSDQESDPEDFVKNMERLVQECKEAISIENEAFSEKVSPSKNLIFISYSHEDKDPWLKRLQVHLTPLEREGIIQRWDDTLIEPGENWMNEIKSALTSAKVGIFLVSADFLASDFISKEELPFLLAAAKERGTIILPVIVGHCGFLKTEGLKDLQAINDPLRPLVDLTKGERQVVFEKVVDRVRELLSTQ